jgi:hypothetical protein
VHRRRGIRTLFSRGNVSVFQPKKEPNLHQKTLPATKHSTQATLNSVFLMQYRASQKKLKHEKFDANSSNLKPTEMLSPLRAETNSIAHIQFVRNTVGPAWRRITSHCMWAFASPDSWTRRLLRPTSARLQTAHFASPTAPLAFAAARGAELAGASPVPLAPRSDPRIAEGEFPIPTPCVDLASYLKLYARGER